MYGLGLHVQVGAARLEGAVAGGGAGSAGLVAVTVPRHPRPTSVCALQPSDPNAAVPAQALPHLRNANLQLGSRHFPTPPSALRRARGLRSMTTAQVEYFLFTTLTDCVCV